MVEAERRGEPAGEVWLVILRKEDIDDLRLGGVPAWLIELGALRRDDGES